MSLAPAFPPSLWSKMEKNIDKIAIQSFRQTLQLSLCHFFSFNSWFAQYNHHGSYRHHCHRGRVRALGIERVGGNVYGDMETNCP